MECSTTKFNIFFIGLFQAKYFCAVVTGTPRQSVGFRGASPWSTNMMQNHQTDSKNLWTLHWHHNDHDGVSNHQPHGCLLNRLFGYRSKKTSKLCVTGLWVGNSPGPVNSLHKGPVMQKMFSFDDVIMSLQSVLYLLIGATILAGIKVNKACPAHAYALD